MTAEHFDVLVVGAGLSGVGAGYYLQTRCPQKRYAILEARETMGGTWDLFRYPGIRSDSDMFTLGYAFRPWRDIKSIADGGSILRYIQQTAADYGIDQKIRYRHRVVSVAWSSADARWTVEVERGPAREAARFTCNFLYMCAGYYSYESGYDPDFPGREQFRGQIVHPQKWTPDIDYKGKKVVVIGSGATAITLVPAMADTGAAHVTMLQRSPTYVMSLPANDGLARFLRHFLPESWVYGVVRWKQVFLAMLFFQLSRRRPYVVKRMIRRGIKAQLPNFDIDRHFRPSYNPWDQRVCFVPDNDLFTVLREKRASIVTDHIETFTPTGIRLKSGQELEADLIVTATGLNMQLMGGAKVYMDGAEVAQNQRFIYKGMMVSDLPNAAFAAGYTNASWTLKIDLTSAYVCRLLNYMDAHGYRTATPRLDGPVEGQPLIDFSSGYVQRKLAELPQQGNRRPWKLFQNYLLDLVMLRFGSVDDGTLEFSGDAPVGSPRKATS